MICHICGLNNNDVLKCAACEAILSGASAAAHLGGKALPPGTELLDGDYLIGSVLSESDFDITYLGRHTSQRRYVVVKEFFPGHCSRSSFEVQPAHHDARENYATAKNAFVAQGQVLSRLRHPNLMAVQQCFEENNTAYMILEFVRGKALQQTIDQRGTYDEDKVRSIISKVGQGLGQLHRQGLLHGNVNPSSITLSAVTGVPQLVPPSHTLNTSHRVVSIDFGSIQPATERTTASVISTLVSSEATRIDTTQSFAALELYGATRKLSERTDIYGLGATAYFLLTGHMPTKAPDRTQGQVMPSPHEVNPGVSRAASDAVMWALELQQSDRPSSIEEFLSRWPATYAAPSVTNRSQRSLARRKIPASERAANNSVPSLRPRRAYRMPRVAVGSLLAFTLGAGCIYLLHSVPKVGQSQPALHSPTPNQSVPTSPSQVEPVARRRPLQAVGFAKSPQLKVLSGARIRTSQTLVENKTIKSRQKLRVRGSRPLKRFAMRRPVGSDN